MSAFVSHAPHGTLGRDRPPTGALDRAQVPLRAAPRRPIDTWKTLWRRAVLQARDELLATEIEAAARAHDKPRLLDAVRPAIAVLTTALATGWPPLFAQAYAAGATRAAARVPSTVRPFARVPRTAEWNEADHPRNPDGTFGSDGGSASGGGGRSPDRVGGRITPAEVAHFVKDSVVQVPLYHQASPAMVQAIADGTLHADDYTSSSWNGKALYFSDGQYATHGEAQVTAVVDVRNPYIVPNTVAGTEAYERQIDAWVSAAPTPTVDLGRGVTVTMWTPEAKANLIRTEMLKAGYDALIEHGGHQVGIFDFSRIRVIDVRGVPQRGLAARASRTAALAALRTLAPRRPASPMETDEQALTWIRDYIEERIEAIGDDTEEAVEALIAAAVAGTLSPKVTALLLDQSIGLTSQQSTALRTVVEELEDAEEGDLVAVGTGFLRIPVGGLTTALLTGAIGTLGAAYLASRIDTNAAHDPRIAEAQGQRDTWQQAIDDGLIDPQTTTKYIIGVDPCETCQSIIDKGPIPFEDDYAWPDEAWTEGPPFHPHCECVEVVQAGSPIGEEDGEDEDAALFAFAGRRLGEWSEDDHPRDEHGQFTGSGGGALIAGKTREEWEAAGVNPDTGEVTEGSRGGLTLDQHLADVASGAYTGPAARRSVEKIKADGGALVVREPAPISDRLKATVLNRQAPADIADQMLGQIPGDLEVKWHAVAGADALKMTAESSDGLEIARTFTREDNGSLTVHHDIFSVPPSAQGSGLAKQVLRDSYETYRQLGVDKIETYANLDVGGYAWAKFGFTADEPSLLAVRLETRVATLASSGKVTDSQRANLERLIDKHRKDPKLPWHIAGAVTSDGTAIGKQLLLGSSWDGTLNLRDRESVARLEHYVGRR